MEKEWQMAARLDYSPVIDIRRARSKNTSKHSNKNRNLAATLEAAKYSTKASDLINWFICRFQLCRTGPPLIWSFLKLRDYVNSADISADQLITLSILLQINHSLQLPNGLRPSRNIGLIYNE